MATMKKPTKTKSKLPIKGMRRIDTTAEKVSAPVRKFVADVEDAYRAQLKDCNIPVFRLIYDNPEMATINSFFLNHLEYEAILGIHIDILDRMMMTAISDRITKDILASIDGSEMVYPGIWDTHTVYSIVGAACTFMKHDTLPERYFTLLQYDVISQEDLDAQPAASYMPFSQYNPNRFVEITMGIRQLAITTIASILQTKMPRAFLSSKDSPLWQRFYDRYNANIASAVTELTDGDTNAFLERDATENGIEAFVTSFERPFLTLMIDLMIDSAVSPYLINMMLRDSTVKVIYEDFMTEEGELKKLGDIDVTYSLMLADDPSKSSCSFIINMRDAIELAQSGIEIDKTRREAFGKSLRTFLFSICAHAINVFAHNVEKNPETIFPDSARKDEVVDPDNAPKAVTASEES